MKITRLLSILACIAISGCGSDGAVRPPRIDVKIVNAAPSYGLLGFSREGALEITFQYGAGIERQYDSGEYDFHIDYLPFGSSAVVRAFSESANLLPDRDYALIVVDPNDELDVLFVPFDTSNISAGASRISIAHANFSLGDLDVYLAAAGTTLSSLTPQARISYGATPASINVTPGTYHLYLTPPNDPNTLLFESADIDAISGGQASFAAISTGEQGFVELSVLDLTTTIRPMHRVDVGLEIRAFQGINDRMPRDILLDDGAMTVLFSSLNHAELSAEQPIPWGQQTVSVTPVATPGTLEATTNPLNAIPGRNVIAVAAGDGSTADIAAGAFLEDRRHMVDQATTYVLNAAGLFNRVGITLERADTNVTVLAIESPPAPTFFGGNLSGMAFAPGNYLLSVVDIETEAPLAGPVELTLEEGGLYGIALSNAADHSTIDIGYFYDFVP
jgi:hypothetical protein